MTSDGDLLRRYAESGSEDAFSELVRRHVDLVYSAALRQVNGDAHLAQDVTQTVFTDLVRKASSLLNRESITGWLYTSTRFAAIKAVRTEQRRRSHEQKANIMQELLLDPGPELNWSTLRPALDEVMHELSETEREAILLRFFENRQLAEIGGRLGLSEDAARKRVERALDKLREYFAQKGITTTSAALSGVIAANAVQAAPFGLGISISAAAAAVSPALAGTTTATGTKAIAMTVFQKALIATILATAVFTGVYQARQAAVLRTRFQRLQGQQASFSEQIAQLNRDNEALSNHLALAKHAPSLNSERLRELLKLRGEVAILRREQRELASVSQSASSHSSQEPATAVIRPAANPAPFQLQLVVDEPTESTEPMTNNASGGANETLYLQKAPLMDYTAIRSAKVSTNPSSGSPQIDIEFSDLGKELFAAVTKENLNKRLAIVLDGQLYSAPVIRSEISDGKAQITGSYSEEQARDLAGKINSALGLTE